MNITISNTFRTPHIKFSGKNDPQSNNTGLPAKIPLTKTEEQFDETLKKLHSIESNIRTQKQNLQYYYTAQDKFEYKELLKEKNKIIAKLNREAKKIGVNYLDIAYDIGVKKEYNRYAPKILRAKSLEDLKPILEIIDSFKLFNKTKELLINLINSMNIIR